MIAMKSYKFMLDTLGDWYKKQTSFGLLTSKKTKENIISQVDALYNNLIERPVWISFDSVSVTYGVKSLEPISFADTDMYILDLRVEDVYGVGILTTAELLPPPVVVISKDIGDTFFKNEDTVSLHSTVYGYINPKAIAISHINTVPNILIPTVGFFDEEAVMDKYSQRCIQCVNEFVVD